MLRFQNPRGTSLCFLMLLPSHLSLLFFSCVWSLPSPPLFIHLDEMVAMIGNNPAYWLFPLILRNPSWSVDGNRHSGLWRHDHLGTAVTHNILEIDDLRMMLRQEGQEIYTQVFSSISLMHLGGEHVSPLARHRRLKEVILLEVDVSRRERIERRIHFSAIHFEAFFHGAVHHLAKMIDEPFNFIRCTRLSNPIDEDYRDHIATFVSLSNESFLLYESVVSFIASSILMDAYPPRMHGKCSAGPYGENRSHSQCSILERYFGDCYKHTVSRPSSNFWIRHCSQRICAHASSIRWNDCCRLLIWALRRQHNCTPAMLNPCHGIGPSWRLTPLAYTVSVGGGIRGVIPLEFLGLLQASVRSGLQVQDLFEQAFGTSSDMSISFINRNRTKRVQVAL